MKINIDTTAGTLTRDGETVPLYSTAGFEQLSRLWVKVGWNEKYAYTFSWMGRPIIQLPEDMVRVQEVIWKVRPTVIIETGVAHGGSLIYYASLCEAMGAGRVIGIDIEIRPHNRTGIEEHPLSKRITLIEGDSAGDETLDTVKSHVSPDDRVLVLLDSCHTREHVARELEAYHSLVTPGSYIVATDGIMRDLHDVPRGDASWVNDHPSAAAEAFAQQHDDFVLEQPPWTFDESELSQNVTHWPSAWLRRLG